MGLIFLIFLLIIIMDVIKVKRALDAAKKGGAADLPTVVPVKTCPPHKWRYHEIKDTEGKTVMWKLVCDVCGPLKTLE